jgi:hypothetical protein
MNAWELEAWPETVRHSLIEADAKTGVSGYEAAERLMRRQRIFGHFQEAARLRLAEAFTDFDVEDLPRSRHQPDPGPSDPLANVLEKSTGTFSTADLLLDSMTYVGLAGRDNLTINLNHLVTRLQTDGHRTVTEVVAQDLIGS